MRCAGLFAAMALTACASVTAPEAAPPPEAPPPSFAYLLEQSPASDWRLVDQQNLYYMQLPGGTVIIELAAEFAPDLVANIKTLAHGRYFDGGVILRAQDNYVVQWGRDDDDPTPLGDAHATVAEPFAWPVADTHIIRLSDPDTYARIAGFAGDFPVASDGARMWLTHCYGMVGVARGDEADSGNGAQLYVVIGQSPRHLDRNIALVGRVLQGMELLSVMPRGTGALGFYETPAERAIIGSVRLGSELPQAERVNLETLRTDSATFRAVIESRRTRRESWFFEPTGRINVCNVPLPVREAR